MKIAEAKTNKTRKPKATRKSVSLAKVKKTTVKKVVKRTIKKTLARKATAKKPVSLKSMVKKIPAKQEVPQEKPRAAKKGKDTGSVEVQIDNFTAKIKSLLKHLKKHGRDNDSRRGLLIMVGKRRRLLNYIKKSDPKRYINIIKKLKLKE